MCRCESGWSPHFDGPNVAGYRSKPKGWLLTLREPPGVSPVSRVRVPLAKPRICGSTCPSYFAEAQPSLRAGSEPHPPGGRSFALPCGQSRSSTARERPEEFGRRGFDSHRARQFRRAVEFGLSVKRQTASEFKPRTIWKLMESHLASCPSSVFDGSQDWVIAY